VTHPTNKRVTCPECDGADVEQEACGSFGWLHCRTCGARWDEEEHVTVEKLAHKRLKETAE
jgi:hypothetical protein